MLRFAPSVLVLVLACDNSGSSTPPGPTGPTTTTEFRISVMNACTNDVVIKLGESAQTAGREQLLLQNQRDTIKGTSEQLFLMSGGEVVASYRPIQGAQKLTVTSDCTALMRDP